MRKGIRIFIVAALLLSLAVVTAAQNKPLTFEVASIKPNRLGQAGGPPRVSSSGGRFVGSNTLLKVGGSLSIEGALGNARDGDVKPRGSQEWNQIEIAPRPKPQH